MSKIINLSLSTIFLGFVANTRFKKTISFQPAWRPGRPRTYISAVTVLDSPVAATWR